MRVLMFQAAVHTNRKKTREPGVADESEHSNRILRGKPVQDGATLTDIRFKGEKAIDAVYVIGEEPSLRWPPIKDEFISL